MSDLVEGVGTASEGGLFARAIEPASGARPPHPDQPGNCLNCGTELVGAYCHACGQRGHIHRTISAFMHDLLHGALHFEGKLWRTLPMLVLQPGTLTRRYIDGARARFVSPMALFLFSVFAMFAVFQMIGLTAPTDLQGSAVIDQSLGEARNTAEAEIAALQDRLAAENLTEAERTEIEERIALLQLAMRESPASVLAELTRDIQNGFEGEEPVAAGVGEANPRIPVNDAGTARLSMRETGFAWLDSGIEKWRENPSLMLYKLQANAYKFSWLLIPISIPFVWLMFAWKRRFKAYDHAIFVTYSLSFMTLLFIALSVLDVLGVTSNLLVWIALLAPPLHIYKQLRVTYGLRRRSALWRLVVLSFFIVIIAGLFLQVLFLLGAF